MSVKFSTKQNRKSFNFCRYLSQILSVTVAQRQLKKIVNANKLCSSNTVSIDIAFIWNNICVKRHLHTYSNSLPILWTSRFPHYHCITFVLVDCLQVAKSWILEIFWSLIFIFFIQFTHSNHAFSLLLSFPLPNR